ncbi:hypothetical protein BC937DRAFT_94444 [Endogone sp. FLAS-F59071]|nr:hypothetical protein BC937DRAFT_94444 [Endogone sp. FLAS-F59071]|eukprot:RUS20760.1 hypothetical protein BC937DRAFT_94444 [Endogone sp. FLAS-F59071]
MNLAHPASPHRRLVITRTKRDKGSSCHNCRQAKAKCSGGDPCDRCSKRRQTSACVYDGAKEEPLRPDQVRARFYEVQAEITQLLGVHSATGFSSQTTVYQPSSAHSTTNFIIDSLHRLGLSVEGLGASIYGIPIFTQYPQLSTPFSNIFLPFQSVQDLLIHHYFRNHWRFWPVIHRRRFLAHVHPSIPTFDFMLLLFAVLATGAKSTEESAFCGADRGLESLGKTFIDMAEELLDRATRVSSLMLVQALVVLSSWQNGTPNKFRSYMYATMACKVAVGLGLQRWPDFACLKSPDELMEHQMVFWCVYIKDTECMSVLMCPYAFPGTGYNIPFPDVTAPKYVVNGMLQSPEEQDWEDIEFRSMEFLIAHAKFCQIPKTMWPVPYSRKAFEISVEGMIELERMFSDWLGSLPPSLQYQAPVATLMQVIQDTGPTALSSSDDLSAFIHINFFFVKLRTYQHLIDSSKHLEPTFKENTLAEPTFLCEFRSQMTDCAQNLTHITYKMAGRTPFWYTFSFLCVLQAAQLHMSNMVGAAGGGASTDTEAIRSSFVWLVKTLLTLSRVCRDEKFVRTEDACTILHAVIEVFLTASKFLLVSMAKANVHLDAMDVFVLPQIDNTLISSLPVQSPLTLPSSSASTTNIMAAENPTSLLEDYADLFPNELFDSASTLGLDTYLHFLTALPHPSTSLPTSSTSISNVGTSFGIPMASKSTPFPSIHDTGPWPRQRAGQEAARSGSHRRHHRRQESQATAGAPSEQSMYYITSLTLRDGESYSRLAKHLLDTSVFRGN